MAKTYISMILAGSIAVTSFAADGHEPKSNLFSGIDVKLSAAAEIDNTKEDSAAAERSHNLYGNLGINAGAFSANIFLGLGSIDQKVGLEDAAITSKIGNVTVAAQRVAQKTEYGNSINPARSQFFGDDAPMTEELNVSGATDVLDGYTFGTAPRDTLSAQMNFGPMTAGVEMGKTTKLLGAVDSDYNAFHAMMTVHGAELTATVAQIKEGSAKVDEVSIKANAKLAGVDLATVVTQDKAKSGVAATSMKKLTFTGIRAHYTRGALTFGAMIEKGKNVKDGGNSAIKANGVSVSAKANKFTYSIGYAQAKGEFPPATSKVKTTSLGIIYKG